MYAAGYMLILWGCLVVLGTYATVRNKVLKCLVGAWDHVHFWLSGQGYASICRSLRRILASTAEDVEGR